MASQVKTEPLKDVSRSGRSDPSRPLRERTSTSGRIHVVVNGHPSVRRLFISPFLVGWSKAPSGSNPRFK
jgi:hypothetical protein